MKTPSHSDHSEVVIVRHDGHGGIGAYFRAIHPHLNQVSFVNVGARRTEHTILDRVSRLIADYVNFVWEILRPDVQLVQLNPSFNFKSLLREGIYLITAIAFCERVIVFFHGWDPAVEDELTGWKLSLFYLVFSQCTRFIVLSKSFKESLRSWGFQQPVEIETTIVDEHLLRNVDVPRLIRERVGRNTNRILYLSRIVKAKGIFTLMKAVLHIAGQSPGLRLEVAGTGSDVEEFRDFKQKHDPGDIIHYHGFVQGEKKNVCSVRVTSWRFPQNVRRDYPRFCSRRWPSGCP